MIFGLAIDPATGSISHLDVNWDRTFKINRSDVEFLAYMDNPDAYPNYVIPDVISNGAKGNDEGIAGDDIAPFHDVDGDGEYNYEVEIILTIFLEMILMLSYLVTRTCFGYLMIKEMYIQKQGESMGLEIQQHWF